VGCGCGGDDGGVFDWVQHMPVGHRVPEKN
jgi:hypothetical protein